MPWNVRLQDEKGKPVIPKDALIEFATIPDTEDFALLRYIDAYGDTYFNTIQMHDFISDWEKLNPPDHQREQWALVLVMAVRCRDEVHLYLKFAGD